MLTENKTNIAVLVSGGGTNLQALIDAERSGIIKSGSIKLVVSNNPDVFALTRARNADIPIAVVSSKAYENRSEFEDALIKTLDDNKIDLIVLAGFMCILGEKFTSHYSDRIINIHPSLIPSFCGKGYYGLKVHEAALAYGVKVSGATVHYVNEIPDGGRIIEQKAVKIRSTDTPESLQKRIMRQAEWVILPRACEKVSREIAKKKAAKNK